MKRRIVAFMLSAAMVFTNIMPAMADTTVIDLSREAAELMQEDDLQDLDQDTVSTNDQEEVSDIEEDTMLDENLLNRPANGTISSGVSYGFAENGLRNSRSENDIDADRAESYQVKYDPRPAGVSGVRDQYLGSCWAYSALAAVESNLIKKGYADTSIDLSEFQMIYFMNHINEDPLGNYTKDTSDSGKNMTDLFNQGGSPKAAVSFLSKWTGPVLERQAPVIRTSLPGGGWVDEADQMNAVVLGQEFCAGSSQWHFKGAKFSDYDTDHINNVKELITNYGGVSMCYYDDGKQYSYTCTGEGEDANYYFAYKAAANHAVEIVGWDDNYSKDNFNHAGSNVKLPEADGAWLVKNSWANTRIPDPYIANTSYISSGYFWISYYDKTISEIIAVEYDSKDTYANMYAYDGGNMVNLSGNKGTYFLNIYEAKAYGAGSVEKIDGVMTYLAANMPYTLTIYTNPVVENGKLHYSGKSKPVTGSSDYEGFYTIDLKDQNIYIPDGMTYGICIETSKDRTDKGLSSIGNGGYYQEPGQTYTGYSLDALADNVDSPYNYIGAPCIRGLTNKASGVVLSESVSLETNSLSLKEGKTATVVVDEVLPENTTNKTCSFYSTDESVATVDETGKVTAVGYGECDIVVTAYDGMSSDTCHVTVYCTGLSLADQQLLVNRVCTIDPVYKNGYKGITSDQLTWESSDPDTATVDSMGRVTAHATGTVTITASIKDPVLTSNRLVKASCKVTIGRMAESIKTDTDTVTLYEGETHQITAEVLPDDTTDKGLTYSCIRDSIAKVSATGLITAVSEGTTTVTLTAMDGSGITKDITVTVLPSIKSIDVYNDAVTLQEGASYKTYFSAIPRPKGWVDLIKVTSSDPTVAEAGPATVSDLSPSSGMAVVTAKKAGECDITVKAMDGNRVSFTFHVTVTAKPGMPADNVNAGETGNTGNGQNQGNANAESGNVQKNPAVETPDRAPARITTGTMLYKVTGTEVELTGMIEKEANAVIPAYVRYNGKNYKVTKIADKAFHKNTRLKTVTIPSTVTEIGNKAFYGCSKLTKVMIPKKVKVIGSKAFYGCKKLTKVTIKSTKLTNVGSKAFTGISKKAVIKVPKKKLTAYTKLLKGKYTKGVMIKK